MSHCDHESGCPYDDIHGTRRCVQHWEPTRRPKPIEPTPKPLTLREPTPDEIEQLKTKFKDAIATHRPGTLLHAEPSLVEPVTPRPTMTPALIEAKQAAEDAGYGQPVTFDEPPARGWLARALDWMLG